MKKITVYQYSLNNIYIINAEDKKHGIHYLSEDLEINRDLMKRVTKATINKHLKDYDKQPWNAYVTTSPLLSTFAENIETKEKHKKLSESKRLASFNSYRELEEYFNDLYDKTENIRKNNRFTNFESSLMKVITKINRKDIKLNQKELMLLEVLEKGAKL